MKTRIFLIMFVIVLLFGHDVHGQTVYQIPFASVGNSIELSVANTSSQAESLVRVSVTNAPAWLKFLSKEFEIKNLAANGETLATFNFSVDKSAPVGKPYTIRFLVTNESGEQWSKEITVSVAAPEEYELFQNYPNPFNPATTIQYQLPTKSTVKLTIFNLLGEEVAALFEGENTAGEHQVVWDAAGVSSGVYIYQLSTVDERGNKRIFHKTMLLLK